MRYFWLVYSAGALATYVSILRATREYRPSFPATPAVAAVAKLVLGVFWPGFWLAVLVELARDDDGAA